MTCVPNNSVNMTKNKDKTDDNTTHNKIISNNLNMHMKNI